MDVEKELEQVKEFKNLGYTFEKNNKNEKHIKERERKARNLMGQIWNIVLRKKKIVFR